MYLVRLLKLFQLAVLENAMDKRTVANLAVKQSLANALFALLEEKGLGSVSINELVTRAGVSRSSFYRNFDSIDDVLTYGNQLLVDEFYETCPYEILDFADAECVMWQLGFWEEHAVQILALSHSGKAHAAIEKVFEIGMAGFENIATDPPLVSERRFAIGAFFAVALDWIEDGAQSSKESLAYQYCELLVSGITTKHLPIRSTKHE